MKTYVLIQSGPHADRLSLARRITETPGVDRVEAVTGPYDLIAEVRGERVDADRASTAIAGIDGVLRAIEAPVTGISEANAATAA